MEKTNNIKQSSSSSADVSNKHAAVWDCGSSLYDSFELKSFEKQLDSAIISSARSMSMPHLSHHRRPPPPPPLVEIKKKVKPTSKISRSLRRLIRSLLFRPKNNKINNTHHHNNNDASFEGSDEGYYYAVYEESSPSSSALTAIPEVAESDGLSPEIKSLVRRTASDRFTFTAAPTSNNIGISCA